VSTFCGGSRSCASTRSVFNVGGVAFCVGTAVDSTSFAPSQLSPVAWRTVAHAESSTDLLASCARASHAGSQRAPPTR